MRPETRLLDYIDEMAPPVTTEEAIARRQSPNRSWVRVASATKRREGVFMTKADESAKTQTPGPGRGLARAVAAFVVVLAVAGIYLATSGDDDQVAEPTPTTVAEPAPTTVAPDVETMSDLEIIEAGVAAFYSGDAALAVELFELPDRTDDQIRDEAAYQAAIGGRLTLNCTEQATPGMFTCHAPYHNAMTDAINYRDGGDTIRVVVEGGVIREFSFPEHSFLMVPLAAFISQVENNQACEHEELLVLPRTADCANLILDNLDDWAVEYQRDSAPD
jgi:hypothetical protein